MRTELIRDGLHLSRIGLGGWELAGGETAAGEPSARAARAVVDAAVACGVNWIYTAEIYFGGRNETLISSILTAHPEVLVATKLGPRPSGSGFRRNQVHRGCRASLQRLGRDLIDVYFLHWPDSSDVPIEETWGAMCELAEQGLVRALGLSNFDLAEIERCLSLRQVDVVQVGLSIIDRRENQELVQSCAALGIPVVIYEPLANGVLTGKTADQLGVSWGRDYQTWDCYPRLLAPGKIERTFAVAAQLEELASRRRLSVAQLALAWVLEVPGVAAAIVGTRNATHMLENASASELTLGRATLEAVEQVASATQPD